MKILTLFLLTIILSSVCLSGCKTKKTKRILINDSYAEGNISSDTVFNGKIKFYDTATNRLVMESNYDKGILNGTRIDYYPNGKIKLIGSYRDGKKNGKVLFYDSAGHLISKQHFYYDLVVGSTIEYKDGNPEFYFFNSLDNNELFFINYDSIGAKKIDQIQEGFFFYNIYKTTENAGGTNDIRKEYFLYLLNPPKYHFTYSLCIIKDNYDIIKEVATFDSEKIWDTFEVDKKDLGKDELYAIRLEIDDPANKDITTMFKKLKL